MEIFSGLMVILAILLFFLFVMWLILPYVIFSMKGQVDRILSLLEKMDTRLTALEDSMKKAGQLRNESPGEPDSDVCK